MSYSYFKAALRDFRQLKLPVDFAGIGAVEAWTSSELYQLIGATAQISHQHRERLLGTTPSLATAIGETLFRAITKSRFQTFSLRPAKLVCCDETESKLLANITTESVTNNAFRSPIIIHKNKRPVAIVKTHGERSAYALETNQRKGLFRSSFSVPPPAFKKIAEDDSLRHTTTAWSVALEDFGKFSPLRYSVLAFPAEECAALIPNAESPRDKLILRASHQIVARQAEYLLHSAQPLPVL